MLNKVERIYTVQHVNALNQLSHKVICFAMNHIYDIKLNSASAFSLWTDDNKLKGDRKVRPFSMFEPTEVPTTSLRKNQSSDDLVRDAQVG